MYVLLSVVVGALIPYGLIALYLVYDRIATWLYWRKRLPRWDEASRDAAQRYTNGVHEWR